MLNLFLLSVMTFRSGVDEHKWLWLNLAAGSPPLAYTVHIPIFV